MGARDKLFGGILVLLSQLLLFTSLILLFDPFKNYWWLYIVKLMTALEIIVIFGILTWIGIAIIKTPSIEEIEAKSK